ncbi:MAG: Uma2 family endonuclease [Rubrobacteraceae bacterium]
MVAGQHYRLKQLVQPLFLEGYNRGMETVKSLAEGKVILHNVSWTTYELLLSEHLDSSAPRFTYDRGELEIISPSPEHEKLNRRIAQLIITFTEEMNIEAEDLGSTTFRREDLERGFEPDSCFYIENKGRIRGKGRIDLTVDPPPDLVIEIDITSPSLDKVPIYARMKVPEVWRFDGQRLAILALEGTVYVESAQSTVLPPLTGATLSDFIGKSKSMKRTAWLRTVREWAREQTG